MKSRVGVAALAAALCILGASDLLACGDKYLSSGRGTRYQRPKNARAASVLIYADPSTEVMQDARVQSALTRGGHRATTVQTLENSRRSCREDGSMSFSQPLPRPQPSSIF